MTRLRTAESVCAGHPDKLCDFISDSVLDECLRLDPLAHVACECMAARSTIIVAGEILCAHLSKLDVEAIVKEALRKVGYDPGAFMIQNLLHHQSADIADAVSDGGAGDQGTVYGYATNETPECLPLPLVLAHRICEALDAMHEVIPSLLPDGKAQVTLEYDFGKAIRVKTVVVSAQHKAKLSQKELREIVLYDVLLAAFHNSPLYFDDTTEILVNPSGRFVIGGPEGDSGLTGRKLMVDTYGGFAPHGGGAFSGKDPSKVDRSGAYMARYIAKNIVAAKLADRCDVAISYAIGVAEPVAVDIDTHCTGVFDDEQLSAAVRRVFDLRPAAIIEGLGLRAPIYAPTACYGHFGRSEFPWERPDRVAQLLDAVKGARA